MIKRMVVRLSVLTVFFAFLAATASAQTPWGSFIELEYHSFVDESVSSIEGFCYGGGFLWAMSHDGELIKIDPSGSVVSIIDILTTYCYGAICYDSGTLWVVNSLNQILPFDTDGNSLGSGIDISGLPAPFNDQIWGAIKDADGFWLYTFWEPMIFKVDMSGNIIKHFPNSWYNEGYTTIAKQGNKIYKFTWNYPASNNIWDYYEALAIDVETGYVTDSWDYPNDYPHPIGLTSGDDCFWTLDFDVFDHLIGIRKLAIPASAAPPGIPSTTWGDFTIKRWGYPPVYPNEDNGLYGFDYDRNTGTIWLGEHYHSLWGIDDVGDLIFPILGQWDCGYMNRSDDIATYGTNMWVALNKGLALTTAVRKIEIVDGVLNALQEWPTGMGHVAGLATDGTYLWVSGRVNYQTTGDPMNTIYKFDLDGNLITQFQYPETTSYDDLTWHRGGLWAISMPSFLSCEIHKIDPDTGEVLEEHATGWVNVPSDNIKGVLASNGASLLTFAALSPTQYGEYYQRAHLRLIEIQLPSDQVKVDFNGDGQEDILWRYYGTGGTNRAWFLGDTEGAGLPLSMADPQMSAGQTVNRFAGTSTVGGTATNPRAMGMGPDRRQKTPLRIPRNLMGDGSRRLAGLTAIRDPRQAGGRYPRPSPICISDPRLVGPALHLATSTDANAKTAAIPVLLGGADVMPVGDLSWQIVGTGDFNNDTHVDILWRNISSGSNVVWFMNGTEWAGSAELIPVSDLTWQIAGTGDFNKDGDVDILWRNGSSGSNVVWYMNGVSWIGSAVLLGVSDQNWRIVATGDFNKDGNVDILWRYNGAGGYNVVWYMNGASWAGSAELITVADSSWQIMGTGDYDADGNIDILWRYNGAGGYNYIWYMNGVTWTGGGELLPVADLTWKIVSR